MSSPAIFNSIPSSPSSSSDHQSTSSSISLSVPSKRKKNESLSKRKHDKYLISAEQWTPIVGPSLPKRQKIRSPAFQESPRFDPTDRALDRPSDPKLVSLFDPDSNLSPSQSNDDDEILLTTQQKVSIYVSCFEEMLNTVLEHEHYLFSPSELRLLSSWPGLSYSSKYLFVRLFMRKHDNWFRLDKLINYSMDIGEIKPACEGLCKSIDELAQSIPPQPNPDRQEQDLSFISPEPPRVENETVLSELVDFLSDPAHPVLTNSPSHSDLPNTNLDTDQLEEWCFLAGRLSHSLTQALYIHGIEEWYTSIPAPGLCEIDGTHVISKLPPIPPAVDIPQPVPSSLPSPPASATSDQEIEFITFNSKGDVQAIPISPPAMPPPKSKPARKSATLPRRSPSLPAFAELDPELRSFASMTSNDYGIYNTDDLFSCMKLDELKILAKKLNANPHTTRDMIVLGIKAATKNQSTLFGAAPPKGKQKKQLSIKFTQKGLKESQILSLNSRILKILGPCIKLTPKVCLLFKRLHLIFYRSTTISEKTMTASMLARMKMRNYPAYQVIRTHSIFDSRETLIKYEEALEIEKSFDDLLVDERKPWNEDPKAKARRQDAKTTRLKQGLELFESAWLRWQQTVLDEDLRLEKLQLSPQANEVELDRSTYYKRRFHPGWPLTRIMQKGLGILARFKEYEREVHVLEALLQQKHFRRGKRGQWYDRLALVLMSKLPTTNTAESSQSPINGHQKSALYTCEQGLLDPDTHQIYRFSLSRRLARLQSIVTPHHSSSTKTKKRSHLNGNHHEEVNNSAVDLSLVEDWKSCPKFSIHRLKLSDDHQIGQKSQWKSMFDDSSLTVEEVSLEHYVAEGWRGFHSEGGILKMIFALVFWNVIFAPVPGAFETAYQSAPLDVATDAFAIVRRPLIEDQINRIEALGKEEIKTRLSESYLRECDRQTMCMGISHHSWGRYQLEDLLEIVECFKPQSFNLISRAFFEDWSIWSAGAPDLCLWKFNEKRCKFVEVKGPGDRLSEQQKNWFSLLSKAEGIEIEICSVKEEE